jgi:hypothetical protein
MGGLIAAPPRAGTINGRVDEQYNTCSNRE